jgi:hypothetical protein
MPIYIFIYLYCKSCILMSDDGPSVLNHVEFIDDIIKILLCLAVTCIPILSQHNGMDSIKILSYKPDIRIYNLPLLQVTVTT